MQFELAPVWQLTTTPEPKIECYSGSCMSLRRKQCETLSHGLRADDVTLGSLLQHQMMGILHVGIDVAVLQVLTKQRGLCSRAQQ